MPSEDLDPFCGRPVSLDIEDVFKKVVRDCRGGYCFELNLLFRELLDQYIRGQLP